MSAESSGYPPFSSWSIELFDFGPVIGSISCFVVIKLRVRNLNIGTTFEVSPLALFGSLMKVFGADSADDINQLIGFGAD